MNIFQDNHFIDSLLRIIDEVNRMEMNLLRMDPSTTGVRQLSRSIERIKNNLNDCGILMVPLIGREFDPGMAADVEFVEDNSLEDGKNLIVNVKSPQIDINGITIRKAKIVVAKKEL